MRKIKHSTGIVVVDITPGQRTYSHIVRSDGTVDTPAGWGKVFGVPEIRYNPPADPKAVHIVAVEDDNLDVRAGLSELVAEHQSRYGECRVWAQVASRGMQRWAAQGCPAVARTGPQKEPEAPEPEQHPPEQPKEQPEEPKPEPQKTHGEVQGPAKPQAPRAQRPATPAQPAKKAAKKSKPSPGVPGVSPRAPS